jgi:hypothetical protein
MTIYSRDQLTTKLIPINDAYLQKLKSNWFENSHQIVTNDEFIGIADEWFKSTKLNDIQGWDKFPCIDVIMGCTHYIESFVLKHGWDGIQILPEEYGYYGMMGKHGTEPGSLLPGIPLIVSLPNWKYADIRPDWDIVLQECEEKDIDIHIDFAWITTATDIQIDLNHPNIKSFAMSMSKYSLQWNRVGLRWSKQRSMDSITIFNQYYGDVNSALTSCGAYMLENIPRDYGWDTYRQPHLDICNALGVIPSKMIHVVKLPDDNTPRSIGPILSTLK